MSKCKAIKRLFPATLAWTLLVSATSIFFLFPCRRLHEDFHYSITIVQAVITFFVISNFFCTTFFDPGIIKRANPDEDKDDFGAPLYKEVIVKGTSIRMKWCATCQFYRPPRCSHCSVCDNCIETFDHHCPWVNNCIGRRNYRHFFFFLIFLTVHMITIFIWCLLLVLNNKNNMHETPIVVAISLMVFISVVFIPIFGLTVFHIILVARGRTTNEQVTGKFQGANNPFSKGLFLNCLYTLCGPRYPGLRRSVAQKDIFGVIEPDTGVKVYMDHVPMDVQKSYHPKTELNDIMLERLDRKDAALNSMNSSHSREQLSRQMSPNQEIQNFPSEIESTVNNGVKRAEGGRHVVTMQQTENGTKETTFIALNAAYGPGAANSNANASNGTSTSSRTTTATTTLPERSGIFSYYNNKISASPSKSTSINEISSHLKRSPAKRNESQGPEGGMVIFYSPDAGVISNSKYSSESELQRFAGSTPTAGHYSHGQHQQQQQFSEKSADFAGYDSSRDKLLKRPMPFNKALEMSNKMEKSSLFAEQGKTTLGPKETDNRQSQYEMNYEISV